MKYLNRMPLDENLSFEVLIELWEISDKYVLLDLTQLCTKYFSKYMDKENMYAFEPFFGKTSDELECNRQLKRTVCEFIASDPESLSLASENLVLQIMKEVYGLKREVALVVYFHALRSHLESKKIIYFFLNSYLDANDPGKFFIEPITHFVNSTADNCI